LNYFNVLFSNCQLPPHGYGSVNVWLWTTIRIVVTLVFVDWYAANGGN